MVPAGELLRAIGEALEYTSLLPSRETEATCPSLATRYRYDCQRWGQRGSASAREFTDSISIYATLARLILFLFYGNLAIRIDFVNEEQYPGFMRA